MQDAANGVTEELRAMARRARRASEALALQPGSARVAALRAMAEAVQRAAPEILAANRADLADLDDTTEAFRDRLALTPARVAGFVAAIEAVAEQPDPLERVLARWERPNGLVIERVPVPLGVIAMIFESRPNVAADAAALAVKSGNAVILRGGSESRRSVAAIVTALRDGLTSAGLPADAVQAVPTAERAAVGALLALDDLIDVVVPRGGRGLIERVAADSRIPVLKHLDGNCHVYIHAAADPQTARVVTLNAKMRRTGVCGAAESLLIDRALLPELTDAVIGDLIEAGCTVRGDSELRALDARVEAATEADWGTEYLDAIISARIVDGIDEAIAHINRYGSHHTDAILTEDEAAARRFLAEVDSAIVLVNASTQFADGGEFGFGAELGIATGRLHARGPIGAAELTTFKYRVHGTGQVRP